MQSVGEGDLSETNTNHEPFVSPPLIGNIYSALLRREKSNKSSR